MDVLIEASENMNITAVNLPTAVKSATLKTPNLGILKSSGLPKAYYCLSENGKTVASLTLLCIYKWLDTH